MEMKTSPLQRSLKLLRDRGYLCGVTERWNGHAKIRQDLFGFIDAVCVKGNHILALQTTSGANVAARVTKIIENPNSLTWLAPSRGIVVHGWRKVGARGKRKTWQCLERPIVAQDFHQYIAEAVMHPNEQ